MSVFQNLHMVAGIHCSSLRHGDRQECDPDSQQECNKGAQR
jgi:hypothetical protein